MSVLCFDGAKLGKKRLQFLRCIEKVDDFVAFKNSSI